MFNKSNVLWIAVTLAVIPRLSSAVINPVPPTPLELAKNPACSSFIQTVNSQLAFYRQCSDCLGKSLRNLFQILDNSSYVVNVNCSANQKTDYTNPQGGYEDEVKNGTGAGAEIWFNPAPAHDGTPFPESSCATFDKSWSLLHELSHAEEMVMGAYNHGLNVNGDTEQTETAAVGVENVCRRASQICQRTVFGSNQQPGTVHPSCPCDPNGIDSPANNSCAPGRPGNDCCMDRTCIYHLIDYNNCGACNAAHGGSSAGGGIGTDCGSAQCGDGHGHSHTCTSCQFGSCLY